MKIRIHAVMMVIMTVLLTITVYAWFSLLNVYPVELEAGLFEAEIDIYIDDVLVTSQSPWYHEDTGQLSLDGADELALNYIGPIKVVVRVTAHNTARFRVRIMDEWKLTRTYTDFQETMTIIPGFVFNGTETVPPYLVNPLFFTRMDDVFYYYDGILTPGETLEITVLDGANGYDAKTTQYYTEQVDVMFSVAVDIVQANRIHERWGVEPDLFT